MSRLKSIIVLLVILFTLTLTLGCSLDVLRTDISDYAQVSPQGVLTIKDKSLVPFNCVIPSTINGITVTSIGKNAFFMCKDLVSVELPDTITEIDAWAFACCYNLERINIPEGVKSIGEDAFSNCKKILSITIPKSVTAIHDCAFEDWTKEQKIYVEYGGLSSYYYVSGGPWALSDAKVYVTVPGLHQSLTMLSTAAIICRI